MTSSGKTVVGWREWVAIPSLNIAAIKAKLDTGARTSALHAFDVVPVEINGEDWIQFTVHPFQRNDAVVQPCSAPVVDQRWVTNPGGRREKRYVIAAIVRLGEQSWSIELSLTDRDEMGFRMLIGRTALHGRFVVDPDLSYRIGRKKMQSRKGQKRIRRKRRSSPAQGVVSERT
jgi:hypothetical protein